MITPFDLATLSFADDVEEAWRALVSRGLPIG
jgi:hypothetical protein